MTPREPGIRDFSQDQQASTDLSSSMPEEEYENFLRVSREMILVREQKNRSAKRESEIKPVLMDLLRRYGDPYGTAGQHQTIEFPTPIRRVVRFVRQNKVSIGVDEVEAEAIARQRGIYDRLFKPVMRLDDDAVMVALREGILTEEDVDKIFPKKTTSAFVVEEVKKK